MENILEVTGLSKTYGSFSLNKLSFALQEGCITGFIGANGAGKTTTLRSILGLTAKIQGKVFIFGLDMEKEPEKIKQRIGVVLDDGCFYNHLSLNEMKSIIAPAYKQWSNKTYQSYLERFALNPKQKIATLSKGMRVKYALALALSHNAELLLMDEPTSGLDPLVRSQLLATLGDYMQNGGKGVFFSTHITSDLDKIADALILMHQGRIVFQNSKDALLDEYRVIKGDTKALTNSSKALFQKLEISDYGFVGISNQIHALNAAMPGLLMERPTIEDIMLTHIQGGLDHALFS